MVESWAICDGFDRYEVSNLGRVRRGSRILKPSNSGRGYLQVSLYRAGGSKRVSVHRLVALAFVSGRSDERCNVNHINHCPSDNQAENLEWVSQRENVQHMIAANRHATGARVGGAKLSDREVAEIRERRASGEKLGDLAAEFSVHPMTIQRASRADTWGSDPAGATAGIRSAGERHPCAKLTEPDVIAIRSRYAEGNQIRAIARDFGISETAARAVALGKTWKHVTAADALIKALEESSDGVA